MPCLLLVVTYWNGSPHLEVYIDHDKVMSQLIGFWVLDIDVTLRS